ncbi:hypothetical protein OROGR_027097 [Orobanche gracilis]
MPPSVGVNALVMASMATLINPISQTSFVELKSTPPSLKYSSSFPKNIPFPRDGSRYVPPRTPRSFYLQSNDVKSSSQTQLSSDTEFTQISDVQLLSSSEVIERIRLSQASYHIKHQQYLAMYSSIYGGITTDPAAMVIPMDDHMVHRGHGVFDTASIMDGHLYELDQHLDRFLRSAAMAKIKLPFNRESIRTILITTVSASKCREGSLRYWLSAGSGDFLLSPSSYHRSSLYAVVMRELSPPDRKGVKVVTSSIPMKPPQFAVMKNVNYLPNVLSKMEAEENGAYAGIWVDEDGCIAEGPNMNVAFVMKDGELLMPSFDKILSGCTAKRVLVLAGGLVKDGKIKGVRLGNVGVEEGKKADEMMLLGSGVLVRAVVQWDDQIIGDGKEGPVTRALLDLLLEDMKSGPDTVRVPVPY